MNSSQKTESLFATEQSLSARDVPITELVSQTYETAQPAIKNRMLAQLVGNVYESANPSLRSRLLEQLLQPVGVLSQMTIAGGIFAKLRFQGGWENLHVRPEDAQNVNASDVILLVDHVQQVSLLALDGLAQILATSPLLASSVAAAVLVKLLRRHSHQHRANDIDLGGSPSGSNWLHR
jgi:hypothetical protein